MSEKTYQAARELIGRIPASRIHLAGLPPHEKFKRLVEMQRQSNAIRRAAGRPLRPVFGG